ncbi:hypothetical protein AB0919_04395 [Streptomyces sp. NPDC046994]|uniref:hypothetical protein n=1 Tax=Streptomyces sp. NPDC046994 TaxID=3155735 RepID=UPI003453DDFE
MTTRFDDGPEFGSDDPLTVILRPPAEHLGVPPGRYEAIRRTAARRRLLRAAAGIGASCAVAVLVALPLHLASPGAPASPAVPLAPPPASGHVGSPTPSVVPTPSASPVPSAPPERVGRRPTVRSSAVGSDVPGGSVAPTRERRGASSPVRGEPSPSSR